MLRSSWDTGVDCTLLKSVEILLEADDCADLTEFKLLPVSARLRGLKKPELMRLIFGEGVSDLDPSSCRVTRRCS